MDGEPLFGRIVNLAVIRGNNLRCYFPSQAVQLGQHIVSEKIPMSLTITLPAELEIKVTEAAALRGRQPLEFVFDALNNALQTNNAAAESLEYWLDWDCIRETAEEADPTVTLQSVRHALSKIPGSMSEAIILEREERF